LRTYSESLEKALIKGLRSTGCNIVDIGLALSPVVYWSQYYFKTLGGAMITASHNPNGWSGVKMADGYSQTLIDGLQEVRVFIENDDFEKGDGTYRQEDVREAYLQDIVGRIKLARPLKVVVECGNGGAGLFVPEAFRKVGCEVVELFCDPDPNYPHHNPNPEAKEAKEALAQKVKEVGADIGISVDGDGDRLGVVDEKGNNIWSDRLLILLARQALEKNPGGKIIFDVKCTEALVEDIKNHGGVPILWITGHSYIKRKTKEEKAVLGGERSGHFFIQDNYYGFDDAVFASLRVVEYLANHQESLSQLIASTPQYEISPTIHVSCPDDKKYEVIEKLTAEFQQEYGDDKVIDVSKFWPEPGSKVGGARVYFGDGSWGLVRASSNEPVLVLVFEAKTEARMLEIKELFRSKLNRFSEVSKEWKND
jgi:phosphomannomutase/phosphoglucomutase